MPDDTAKPRRLEAHAGARAGAGGCRRSANFSLQRWRSSRTPVSPVGRIMMAAVGLLLVIAVVWASVSQHRHCCDG